MTCDKDLLEESLLKSDFTFGFELEGVASNYRNSDGYYDDDEDNYDDEDDDGSEYYGSIDSSINRLFNKCGFGEYKGKGEIQHDGSIDADYGDVAFEWASPVLKATPKNFQATIKFLSELGDECDIHTNSSCGFHHHLSWGGITERDMIWTYINLCMDEDYIDSLEKLKVDDGSDLGYSINMASDRWASKKAITDIRNAVLNKDWETIVDKMSDDKYRILRIHPYGTIEWRGPRDFLNEGGIKEIHSFYMKFNNLISKVIKCQNNKTIEGTDITKEELFDNMTKAMENMPNKHPELEFLHRNGEYRDRNMSYKTEKGKALSKRVLEALENYPELLLSIIKKSPKNIAKLFINNKDWDIGSIIGEAFNLLDNENDKKELAELLTKGFLDSGYSLRQLTRFDSTFLNYIDLSDTIINSIKNTKNIRELNSVLDKDESLIKQNYDKVFNLILSKVKSFSMDRWDAKSLISYIISIIFNSNNVSDEYIIRTAKLIVRIAYKYLDRDDEVSRWNTGFTSFINKLSNALSGTSEEVSWNDSIINAIIDKGQARFLSAFIIAPSSLTEKQKKQIISLCVQYPRMKNFILFDIDDSVFKKYLELIKD